MSDRPRTDALFERCKNKSNIEIMAELEELCRTIEGELTQSKEANAGLMRACDNLERQLADKRSQINRLISVIKSRNTDKVYLDKKYNELRDEVMATREQRDTLAEALSFYAAHMKLGYDITDSGQVAENALAAVKGGQHEEYTNNR
jgi:chromosome segregation ATPase